MASPEKSLSRKPKTKKPASKKGKRKPRHTHIDYADNGGATVNHQFEGEPDAAGTPTMQNESHAFSNPNDLLGHLQDITGGQLPQGGGGQAGPGAGM